MQPPTTGEIIALIVAFYVLGALITFIFTSIGENDFSKVLASTILWPLIMVILCIVGFVKIIRDMIPKDTKTGGHNGKNN